MIVVADEVSDLLFEIAGSIIVLEQDAVLEGLMPTINSGDKVYYRTGDSGARGRRKSVPVLLGFFVVE